MKKINIRLAFFVLVLALSSLTWIGVPTTLAYKRVDHRRWIELQSVQFLQTVNVQTPGGDYSAVFQSEIHVFPNREAQGFLQLLPATRPDDEILVLFEHGDVRFNRDGTVAAVLLHGRTAMGDTIIVMITPAASEDCLIYTTAGNGFHATWEVPGRLTVIHR